MTAAEAAAYYFNWSSYLHRDVFNDKNDGIPVTGRVLVQSNGLNDQIVAYVDTDPSRLSRAWRQEFVFRQVLSCDREDGTYFVAAESVNDDIEIDYGFPIMAKLRKNRVKGTMLFMAEPDKDNSECCTVTLLQQLDQGNALVHTFKQDTIAMCGNLSLVGEMRERLNKDKESAARAIANLAKDMKEAKPSYNGVELSLVEDVRKNYKRSSQSTGGWKPLRSQFKHVKMHYTQLPGDSNYVARAIVVVDTDIFTAAAWEWDKESRFNLKKFYNSKGIKREVQYVNDHHLAYQLSRQMVSKEAKLTPRFFDTQAVWKVEKNKEGEPIAVLICYKSVNHGEPIPKNHPPNVIRAKAWTYWKMEKMIGRGDISQTKVTRATQINLGGFIPVSFVNSQSSKAFKNLDDFRLLYDKSAQLNRMTREKFAVSVWSKRDDEYSDFEKEIIRSGEMFYEAFENSHQTGQLHKRKHSNRAESYTIKGKKYNWGLSSAKIRANIVDVLAYLWDEAAESRKELEIDNLEYR